ncbi:MAG: hypothetical protein IPP47_24865 [Bryobacterales bacterium]|nr:hypothetical protein [Bryobacterales bacterium]
MQLHAPAELTTCRLHRLGEGIGKVVYASEHWVVKRARQPSEILALIVIWKMLRRLERLLPGHRVSRPAHQFHFLRVLVQALVRVVPRGLWMMTHAGEVWRTYRARDQHGETLTREHLAGTPVVPRTIRFPPTRVEVDGWPGYLTVTEATERMEATLHQRLHDLAAAGRLEEVEVWLNRWLALRQAGWQRGVFSLDTHLKNFGVTGDRVVLLDPGGLTQDWSAIEKRLTYEGSVASPHRQLGLGTLLRGHPEIARRFDAHWRATVNPATVQHHWPTPAVRT